MSHKGITIYIPLNVYFSTLAVQVQFYEKLSSHFRIKDTIFELSYLPLFKSKRL